MTVTRRELLRLAAAAATTPLLPRAVGAEALETPGVVAAGRFLSAPEMALLDELTELIVPADEHSPGARAAGVAAHIDATLAEYDPEIPDLGLARERWRAGLAALDALAHELSGKAFLEASADERVALLERLAAREKEPQSDAERFFAELKRWTAHGYYTSRIGIHEELEYKGNTVLVEFEGIDPASVPRAPAAGDGGHHKGTGDEA